MFITGRVNWRDERFHILNTESRLSTDSILSEELIQGSPQKLAIDEEFEGNRLLSFEQPIHESR